MKNYVLYRKGSAVVLHVHKMITLPLHVLLQLSIAVGIVIIHCNEMYSILLYLFFTTLVEWLFAKINLIVLNC